MRVGIAALIGAILMFLWGFVSHMLLPIGEMGFRPPANEEIVLAAASAGLKGHYGVTMVPWMGPEGMNDPQKMAAYEAKSAASPYAFIVYRSQGDNKFDMGRNLAKEFATNLFCAAILAYVLALGALGMGKRVLVAGLLGLFAWGAVMAPFWNWYRFPMDFSMGILIEQVVGWLLAGAGIAWWLGRGEKAG